MVERRRGSAESEGRREKKKRRKWQRMSNAGSRGARRREGEGI